MAIKSFLEMTIELLLEIFCYRLKPKGMNLYLKNGAIEHKSNAKR